MNKIRTIKQPKCLVCKGDGKIHYENQIDKLFKASGEWNLKKCTNAACGLIWLDPMPIEDDIGKAYQSYYTHQQDERSNDTLSKRIYSYIKHCYLSYKFDYLKIITKDSFWHRVLGKLMYLHPGRRADLDFSIMYLKSKDNGLLLEIGCGSGSMLKNMELLGWQVEGVEVDPKAVEIARKKGLNVFLGDLHSQKYPNDHFDAITISHVIEHVHKPLELIEECRRILKSSGTISIVTPNTLSLGHLLYKSSWLHLDPPRHLHLFSPVSLSNLVQESGLKIKSILTTLRDAQNLYLACRSIEKNGSYVMGSDSDIVFIIWARTMQLVEWFVMKIMPNKGEEIVVIAKK